jgi:hypothetical protein
MSSKPALEPNQPHIQWISVTLSPRAKRQGREAYQSTPNGIAVKRTCIYIHSPRCPQDLVLTYLRTESFTVVETH